MAQYLTNVVGNDALRHRLALDILSDSLPHAIIIEGRDGSGRHTLARNIAAALCCSNRHGDTFPCLACEGCRKMLESKTPDIIYVTRDEDHATIGVDTSRFIREDAMVVPNDFDRKIYVIEQADLMTEQAQSALLLTLEEPHSYAVFILLCNSATSLLETVRSRAPIIRMEAVPDELLTQYLISHDSRGAALAASPEQLSAVVREADGCIGRALTLLDPKKAEQGNRRHRLAEDVVRAFAQKAPPSRRTGLCKSFSSVRADAIEELNTLTLALRDLLVIKRSDNAPLCFWLDREEATELAYCFTNSALLSLCDRAVSASKALSAYANVRLTIISLIM